MAQAQQSLYEAAVGHCCSKCRFYIKRSMVEDSTVTTNGRSMSSSSCWLCLGLWQEEDENVEVNTNQATPIELSLRKALESCCAPYGGIGASSPNRFSQRVNQTHTVSLSGDLSLRYRWLASFSPYAVPFSVYLQDLKQHLYSRIEKIIKKCDSSEEDATNEEDHQWVQGHRRVFEEEEQGSLSIHLLCLPPKDHPMNSALNDFMKKFKGSKSKKQRNRYNKRQKCGPFTTQGGDPRQNLEVRLHSKGYKWISQSTAEEVSSAAVPPGVASYTSTMVPEKSSSFRESSMMGEYHVAVFRRPIFLYGYYTKSRRDVSQSPFVVFSDKSIPSESIESTDAPNQEKNSKQAQTLGVTSVEEQICSPIEDLLGISTQNNLLPDLRSSSGGGVLYGMIKFHASGREDMDVRMLVRSKSSSCHGRPFCVQIIDALKPISSPKQLQALVKIINQSTTALLTKATPSEMENVNIDPENDLCNSEASYYGNNPMGVGISPDAFRPVPSKVFSGLQKDTESKTKHYGCYCWSKDVIPDGDDLTKILFRDVGFPFTIGQRTPFRVLHRRANTIRERQILDAKATKIDDHHFRLELSTQAGTYIKEFVSSDFGRTIPSISSLMGCKTTLIELDCEGIEILTEHDF